MLVAAEETMKQIAATLALIGAAWTVAAIGAHAQHSGGHIMLQPSDMTWTDLPALPGVKIAVIEGPLTEAGPIMFRLKFPANYKVMPHRHPGIEHITVISGTLHLGMGDTFDASKTHALTVGSVGIMPPGTNHFVWTSVETITQVHSTGPWSVTYVNPADDPRKN
jgi:quercetin dioxygenase-like cupin family protein